MVEGKDQKHAGRPARAIVRLQLDIQAKKALDDLSERRGMTQIAIMSRMVEWFAAQDEVVQASVLNLLSAEHFGDLSIGLLRRLVKAGTPSQ
jgi:hypothetical protein